MAAIQNHLRSTIFLLSKLRLMSLLLFNIKSILFCIMILFSFDGFWKARLATLLSRLSKPTERGHRSVAPFMPTVCESAVKNWSKEFLHTYNLDFRLFPKIKYLLCTISNWSIMNDSLAVKIINQLSLVSIYRGSSFFNLW